jgi:hypothetical protein
MSDLTTHPAVEKIAAEIDEIGLDVLTSFTLADAMREGSRHTSKLDNGWIKDGNACALGAAYLSAIARGYAH